MFSYIRGTLAHKDKDFVVVDNQGIGFFLHVPSSVPATLHTIGQEVTLYTYMAVREDDIALYGFLQAEDLAMFKLLISVSGIGPKAALGILSTLSPAEFYLAMMHENVKALTRVSGVGPKSAKRLIIELKDKVAALGSPGTGVEPAVFTGGDAYSEAMEALMALGYNGTEAQSALNTVQGAEGMDTEELLRKALARLGAK
ncbi:MAG: Holliday junction branch migration protein RuvA [Bacillota bacterium]|nr:Holliday junction branch migration protein RuvA [Bacillota bacterium]MDW7682489.1 Holliday junction branch migration protein RuvA [Bacillota bacterium]